MNPPEALISVGIPVYNGNNLVRTAISSVLSQLDVEFELLILDNGSDKDQREHYVDLAEDHRVKILPRRVSNSGAADGWNALISQSQGQYLKILPHDDILLPGALSRELHALENNRDAVCVSSRRYLMTAKGRVFGPAFGMPKASHLWTKRDVFHHILSAGRNSIGPSGSYLVRSDVARQVWFRESSGYVMDLEFAIRTLDFGSLCTVDDPGSAFRLSRSSWTSRAAQRQLSNYVAMLERFASQDSSLSVTKRMIAQGARNAATRPRGRRLAYFLLG